ncbi:MAG: TauD/TfdA dioxygenase family protein [Candidatus Phaeomarinobacter sp.]
MLSVTPTGEACGAFVSGIDLTQPLDSDLISEIRNAWLEHHVLVFPDQPMSDDDLERFTLYFGDFGHDPFFAPIDGRKNIAAIERRANETSPLFAEGWHTDWSFQEKPPIATCLMGLKIPPNGGDTYFANQHMAYDHLPADLKKEVEGLVAVHSAEAAYAPDGMYGQDKEEENDRSMRIISSEEARLKHEHPLVRPHTETGRPALFSTVGYIQEFKGMSKDESYNLLVRLYEHQTKDEFVYRHKWKPNMLVMWDNRCLLHRASGGYDGHDRLLHRTTVSERAA